MNNSKNILPPKLFNRFLKWFCHPDILEDLEGDLQELFNDRVDSNPFLARLLYLTDVLLLFRPGIIRSIGFFNSNNNIAMFINYLKSAWRNLLKHKGFSMINISSLSIGIAVCLIIFLFLKDERSFDEMHQDKIYRLCEVQSYPGTKTQQVALSAPGMGPTITERFSEIREFTRFRNWGDHMVDYKGKKLSLEKTVSTDKNFFDFFNFPILYGDKTALFNNPGDIVISEETAKTLFGKVNSLGEVMHIDGNPLTVTGIMKDIPENSHLQFSAVVSMETRTESMTDFNKIFYNNSLYTYLKLVDDVDLAQMSIQFPDYLREASGNPDFPDIMEIFVQPLKDVHLNSTDIQHDYANYRKFNGDYINVFLLVGIFILIIASVNFMNLTTARASSRSKEIGVRKAIGALKRQVFKQFITESVMLAMIALIFAVIIDLVSIPFLNNLIDRKFALTDVLFNWQTVSVIISATVLLGILAGLYPSIHLSSFNTVKILKGINLTGKKSLFRGSLVVFQFSLALGMIVCTLIVVQQLDFMKNKDIGFDKDHILLVELNGEASEKYTQIKKELKNRSNILGITGSRQRLGNNLHQSGFKIKGDSGVQSISPSHLTVDYDFLDVYGIKLTNGRNFSKDYAKDNGLSFIINEAVMREWGMKEPVGIKAGHGWYPDDSLGTIIGVTEDFNFNSLHHKVNTLFLSVHDDWSFNEMSVKLNGSDIKAGIEEVEAVYSQFVTDYPIKFTFLDEHMQDLYKSDSQMGSVITITAFLSIFIGCMGLFGLASISIQKRIKEIGIRKVIGASPMELMFLLSKNFALMVLVSFIIASPVTYLLMSDWLSDFAFRININPLIFIAGGIISMMIALLTIAFHVLKVVRENPVKALKYE